MPFTRRKPRTRTPKRSGPLSSSRSPAKTPGRKYRSLIFAILRQRRWLAVSLTVVATLLCLQSLSPAQPDINKIPVPRTPISRGHILTSDDLVTVNFLHESLPAGISLNASQLLGRVTGDDLPAGVPILTAKLAQNAGSIANDEAIIALPLEDSTLNDYLQTGDSLRLLIPPSSPAESHSSCADPAIVLKPGKTYNSDSITSLSVTNEQPKSILVKIKINCAQNLAFVSDMSMIRLVLVNTPKTKESSPHT